MYIYIYIYIHIVINIFINIYIYIYIYIKRFRISYFVFSLVVESQSCSLRSYVGLAARTCLSTRSCVRMLRPFAARARSACGLARVNSFYEGRRGVAPSGRLARGSCSTTTTHILYIIY